MGPKYSKRSPTNHSRKFSKFSWILFPMFLTKLSLFIFIVLILIFWFLTIFCPKKTPLSGKKAVVEQTEVKYRNGRQYFNICGVPLALKLRGHFGINQCTYNFSENTIFKMMLLLHLGFFYNKLFTTALHFYSPYEICYLEFEKKKEV